MYKRQNGNLANSSLTNVTDEAERRVDLKVGISYDSDIRSARKAVQEIAKKNPYVLPEREITCLLYTSDIITIGSLHRRSFPM